MKKSLLLVLAGVIIAAYSCGDKNTATDETTTETTDQSQAPVAATPDTTLTETGLIPAESAQPSQANPTITQVQPGTPAPAGNNSAAGPLNPAHGEPGHRCEIAVGAPLSSAPASSATPAPTSSTPVLPGPGDPPTTQKIQMPATGTSSPTINMAPSTGSPATTAPGMNPPHGEPGHDCSIAVGAPLKK